MRGKSLILPMLLFATLFFVSESKADIDLELQISDCANRSRLISNAEVKIWYMSTEGKPVFFPPVYSTKGFLNLTIDLPADEIVNIYCDHPRYHSRYIRYVLTERNRNYLEICLDKKRPSITIETIRTVALFGVALGLFLITIK